LAQISILTVSWPPDFRFPLARIKFFETCCG
jgi:hypothetical protein